MQRIKCPKCAQLLQVADSPQAMMVRCPKCGQMLKVAGVPAAPAPPAVAPPPPPIASVPPAPAPAVPVAPAPPAPVVSETAAGPADLGRVLEEYRPRRWWIGLAVAAAATVVGVACTVWAFQKVYYQVRLGPDEEVHDRWRYTASSGTQNLLVLSSMAAALATVFFLVQTLRCINLHAAVCENGFSYRRWWRRFSCPWAAVESVSYLYRQRAGLVPARFFCEVNKENGESVSLPSSLPRLGELCGRIRAATTKVLFPRAVAALRRGEEVEFGPGISLGPEGLTCYRSRLAWADVGKVSRVGGNLVVSHRDSGKEGVIAYLGGVANADTLLDLLDDSARIAASIPRRPARERPPARKPARAGVDGGYVCPRCGGLVQRGAQASAAGATGGGLAGALLAMGFGSFYCQTCGPIPKAEFPPAVRRRMMLRSVFLILGGIAALLLAIGLVILTRH